MNPYQLSCVYFLQQDSDEILRVLSMGKTFHIECFRCEVNALVFCHFLVYMQLVSRYKTSRIEVKEIIAVVKYK